MIFVTLPWVKKSRPGRVAELGQHESAHYTSSPNMKGVALLCCFKSPALPESFSESKLTRAFLSKNENDVVELCGRVHKMEGVFRPEVNFPIMPEE